MSERLTPAGLRPGRFYTRANETPPPSPWEIVSVGPKWITFREWYRDYGTGPMRAHGKIRLLRSGWEAPVFVEVPHP